MSGGTGASQAPFLLERTPGVCRALPVPRATCLRLCAGTRWAGTQDAAEGAASPGAGPGPRARSAGGDADAHPSPANQRAGEAEPWCQGRDSGVPGQPTAETAGPGVGAGSPLHCILPPRPRVHGALPGGACTHEYAGLWRFVSLWSPQGRRLTALLVARRCLPLTAPSRALPRPRCLSLCFWPSGSVQQRHPGLVAPSCRKWRAEQGRADGCWALMLPARPSLSVPTTTR